MPRFRFTIRRMMIAVAIVGIAIGGEMIRRRWASYRDDARRWTSLERIALKGVAVSLQDAESWKSRASRERGGAGVFVQSGPDREREARWCDSRADFRTLQAKIFHDQAESFGRLAGDYARAGDGAEVEMDLMMLLGALMIVWVLGVYFVTFFKTKRLRHLAAALVPLPVAILLFSIA